MSYVEAKVWTYKIKGRSVPIHAVTREEADKAALVLGWDGREQPNAAKSEVTRGEGDCRPAAFLLLDKRLSEHPHLTTSTNPAGDYEIRCSVCREVETYLGAADKEVDVLTFALHVTGKHAHNDPEKQIHEAVEQSLENASKVGPAYPVYVKRGEKLEIVQRSNGFYWVLGDEEGGPFDSIEEAREGRKQYVEERWKRERGGK